MFRIICFCLLMVGCVVMAISTWRYYKFIRYSRYERYTDASYSKNNEKMAYLSLLVMLFFVVGFVVGGVHVITTPVDNIYLFVSVVFFLGALFIANMVHVQINMASALREKTLDVMRGFVNSIEQKDPYTQGHSRHVYFIVDVFYDTLPGKMRQAINKPKLLDAALLHDVGKIGVSNSILNKKGPLDATEWEAIRTHPVQGAKMLKGTCFAEISTWIEYHHERVDGSGYYGIAGKDIPLEARIIALVDTYSAMTTNREYRPRRSHGQAMEIMESVAGSQLDAELVGYFAKLDEGTLAAILEQVKAENIA